MASVESETNNGKGKNGIQTLLMRPPTTERETLSMVNKNALDSDGEVKAKI